MCSQSCRFCLVALLTVIVTLECLRGDDDHEDARREAAAKRLAVMKAEIDKFELSIGDGNTQKLVRLDEPIQRWNNAIVPIVDATVFLWTCDGRPAVIAQLAQVPRIGLCLEAHSLTSEPLFGRFRGRRWAPAPPGVEWLPAPNDEAPAATAELRRIQMRKIAESYRVSDLFDNTLNELRLVPNPLHRYSCPESGILDGAIFSFALGTDPEVMILVESQKKGDANVWKVAFARMTGYACEAKLEGNKVWSCKFDHPYPPTSVFFQVM
jgi:hypothetical protein